MNEASNVFNHSTLAWMNDIAAIMDASNIEKESCYLGKSAYLTMETSPTYIQPYKHENTENLT